MSEHIETQQAAAEGLGALGLNATLMVHFPSKIKAPEGILLTTVTDSEAEDYCLCVSLF